MIRSNQHFHTEMQNKSMTLNNELAKKNDFLKELEAQKNQLVQENEEATSRKTS